SLEAAPGPIFRHHSQCLERRFQETVERLPTQPAQKKSQTIQTPCREKRIRNSSHLSTTSVPLRTARPTSAVVPVADRSDNAITAHQYFLVFPLVRCQRSPVAEPLDKNQQVLLLRKACRAAPENPPVKAHTWSAWKSDRRPGQV